MKWLLGSLTLISQPTQQLYTSSTQFEGKGYAEAFAGLSIISNITTKAFPTNIIVANASKRYF